MPYFCQVGVVGVARAEHVLDLRVVLAARVDVADEKRDRRAGGAAFEHAGEDLDGVLFAPLRHVARGAGLAPVELGLDVGFGELQSRRAAVDDAADRRAVASPNEVTQKSLPSVLPDMDRREYEGRA